MNEFTVNYDQSNRLFEAINAYSDNAEDAINNVLWNEAGGLIEREIKRLLPRSNRTWKGKRAAAADANPFKQQTFNLSVKVTTVTNYGYLYFADDGTNTKNHVGNQQFMLRGAENKADEIVSRCLGALQKEF